MLWDQFDLHLQIDNKAMSRAIQFFFGTAADDFLQPLQNIPVS